MVRAICVAGVLMAFGIGVISAADPAVPAKGQAALSAFLSDVVASGEVPGVVAMVVGRDRILFEGAFGKRDVARNADDAADTLFRIASMTKPLTTTAILMLVEEGARGRRAGQEVPAPVRPRRC